MEAWPGVLGQSGVEPEGLGGEERGETMAKM